VPHHDDHWPQWGTGNPTDGTHLRWPTGPTPRATGATDRFNTVVFIDIADPSHTTAVAIGASICRSRPVGLWYATGTVESMRQSGAQVVRSLRHPVWQRLRARVLGLDGRVEPLSGGDGRGRAAPRKAEK
jgi:hypothetical protein